MYPFGSFRAALGGLAVAGAIVVFATPAWAHGVAASGAAFCADDGSSWSVAWSVGGTHNEGNDIASVSAADANGAVGLAPAAPAPWDTVFTALSTYPADVPSASLDAQMSFANGEHRRASAAVSRPEGCMATTTTETLTTAAQPIAAPTTAVETTTTTVAPPTTAAPNPEAVATTATTAGATVSTASAALPAEVPSSTAAPAVLAAQVTTTTAALTTSPASPENAAATSAPVLPATGASGVGARAVLGGLLFLTGVALAAGGWRVRRSTR